MSDQMQCAHDPEAGPFKQAVELLEDIYSDTRHGIVLHWSKQIDLTFFLHKHSRRFAQVQEQPVGREWLSDHADTDRHLRDFGGGEYRARG